VDVIIPFHGRVELLTPCLAALARNGPPGGRVYLVDDASPVRPDRRVRSELDALGLPIEWLSLERRRGFVGAVNHAWERCREPAALVLNNDVIVPPDLVRRLGACLETDGRIAAVAPASDNPTDLFQYRSAAGGSGTTEARYLTAMCMAVRRAAVVAPPLFDPVYAPGYFEDLDLCCRLREAGWRLAIVEECLAHHVGRATFGDGRDRNLLVQRNYAIFHARWSRLDSHPELDRLLWGREAACR
jgi:GT2 family glycosyltransferase